MGEIHTSTDENGKGLLRTVSSNTIKIIHETQRNDLITMENPILQKYHMVIPSM